MLQLHGQDVSIRGLSVGPSGSIRLVHHEARKRGREGGREGGRVENAAVPQVKIPPFFPPSLPHRKALFAHITWRSSERMKGNETRRHDCMSRNME